MNKQFTITKQEADELIAAQNNKQSVLEIWTRICTANGINLSKGIKHLGGYQYDGTAFEAAPPVPPIPPAPMQADDVEYSINFLPEKSNFAVTERDIETEMAGIMSQTNDIAQKVLSMVTITNMDNNTAARAVGAKAKKFLNQLEDIRKQKSQPHLDAQRNYMEIFKKIANPVQTALRQLGDAVNAFESQVQKQQEEAKLKAAQELNLQKAEQEKVLELNNAIKNQIDDIIIDFTDTINGCKTKAKLKKEIENIESWKPIESDYGSLFDYLKKQIEGVLYAAKRKLENQKEEISAAPESKFTEETWKQDCIEFYKILGIKEADIEATLETALQLYGSYEMVFGKRNEIRDKFNESVMLKSSAGKEVKIKNRRKITSYQVIKEADVPHEYMEPSKIKIKLAMKLHKDKIDAGEFNIPGIEWSEETKVTFR
jgi:hypothetical protein